MHPTWLFCGCHRLGTHVGTVSTTIAVRRSAHFLLTREFAPDGQHIRHPPDSRRSWNMRHQVAGRGSLHTRGALRLLLGLSLGLLLVVAPAGVRTALPQS